MKLPIESTDVPAPRQLAPCLRRSDVVNKAAVKPVVKTMNKEFVEARVVAPYGGTALFDNQVRQKGSCGKSMLFHLCQTLVLCSVFLSATAHFVYGSYPPAGSRGIGLVVGTAIGGLLAQPAINFPNIVSSTGLFGRYVPSATQST